MKFIVAAAILAFASVAQADYYGADENKPSSSSKSGSFTSTTPGKYGGDHETGSKIDETGLTPPEGYGSKTSTGGNNGPSTSSTTPANYGGDKPNTSTGGNNGPSTSSTPAGYYVAPPSSTPPTSTGSKAAPSDTYTPACGDATPTPTGGKNGPSTTAYAAKNTYSKNDSNIVYSAASSNGVASASFLAAAVGVAALFLYNGIAVIADRTMDSSMTSFGKRSVFWGHIWVVAVNSFTQEWMKFAVASAVLAFALVAQAGYYGADENKHQLQGGLFHPANDSTTPANYGGDKPPTSTGGHNGPSTTAGYYVVPPSSSTPPASTSSKAAQSGDYTPVCGDSTPASTGSKAAATTTQYAAKNTYSKNDSNIVYSAASSSGVASAGFLAAAVGVAALFLETAIPTFPSIATTLRVLAKRNKDRLARLQASQEGASPATGAVQSITKMQLTLTTLTAAAVLVFAASTAHAEAAYDGGYYVAPPSSSSSTSTPTSTGSVAAPSGGYTPVCGDTTTTTPTSSGSKAAPTSTVYAAKNTYSQNSSNLVYSAAGPAAGGASVAAAGFVAAAAGVVALFL
ncbi:hypothetical protein DFJ73DRAFT_799646 [Zopfochytrium polystomum]|nr:hypothetical protein DFJ73DRAFT_799646 [Zopfochytrium polystomum]